MSPNAFSIFSLQGKMYRVSMSLAVFVIECLVLSRGRMGA